MSETTTVPVLVQSASRDPVEELNSLLRNSGLAVQCHWIPTLRDVADAFAQHEPELLVAVTPTGAELAALAGTRDQLAAEVPLIVLREQVDGTVSGEDMAHGARDTTTLASPAHVQAVIRRELRGLQGPELDLAADEEHVRPRGARGELGSPRTWRELEGSWAPLEHVGGGKRRAAGAPARFALYERRA